MGKNPNTKDPLETVIDAALNLEFHKIAIEVRRFHSKGYFLGNNGVEHEGYWTNEIDYNNFSGLMRNDQQLMHYQRIIGALIDNTQEQLKKVTNPELRYKILSKALSLLQSEKIIDFFNKAISYSTNAHSHIQKCRNVLSKKDYMNWNEGLQTDIKRFNSLKGTVSGFLTEYAKLSVTPSITFASIFRQENNHIVEKRSNLEKRSRSLSF